ncbi:uncharacterized protein CTRU02_213950 [Colletotrichum truncatum]|uniref:Uncharacterized protein n=1 Tax=Colletotrichum truncatum TaxID=5467 RepID=A0ACC3YH52_COLTU|nr:uncharacterized protein CTRU02_06263 [Colletotrichum truncatum]KAF6792767.1 hypothetical protein CTRU02_06263 [Colletotrichum truncatum]
MDQYQYSRGPNGRDAVDAPGHVDSLGPDSGRQPDDHAVRHGLLSDLSDGHDVKTRQEDDVVVTQRATWRPKWLRTPLLSAFLAFFILCVASLPAMYVYSRDHNGLVQTRQNLVYLWRFGPTAIITICSIFWSRVEYQALRYMPWIAHHRKQSLEDEKNGYTLDYTAMLMPVVVYQSLRRKHFLVFLVTLASILLRVLIVLAPSLYSLANIEVPRSVDIQLLDSFNTTDRPVDELTDVPGLVRSFYLSLALRNFELQRPFGLGTDVAYQTFTSRNGTARGTVSAPLTAVVDGIFADTHCSKLESWTASPFRLEDPQPNNYYYFYEADASLQFEGCDTPVDLGEIKVSLKKDNKTITDEWLPIRQLDFGWLQTRPCPNLPQQGDQWVYYTARAKPQSNAARAPSLIDVAAVVCTSTSWVSKLRVADDGINVNTTLVPGEAKRPFTASFWDDILLSGESNRMTGAINNKVVETASWLQRDWSGPIALPGNQTLTQYSTDIMYDSIMNISRVLLPSIGHHVLRQANDNATSTDGFTIIGIDKLVVNQWVCIAMAALFGLLACIVLAIIIQRGKVNVWCRNPTTVLGHAMFLQSNQEFSSRLGQSVPDEKTTNWGENDFTPLVLRTWVRTSFVILVLLITAVLIWALQYSQLNNGLITVPKDGYVHLVWTSLPTIIMLSVALYVSSCDYVSRTLATLYSLSSRSCGAPELDMSYADMLGFKALAHSIQKRIWNVTIAQFLAIICGFLTTLTSVLYVTEAVPEPKATEFRQETWFGSRVLEDFQSTNISRSNREIIGSLLIRQKTDAITYPLNTYDDLLFPVLENMGDLELSRNLSVEVTVPAAKLQPTCHRLPSTSYNASCQSFGCTIVETFKCPNGSQAEYRQFPKAVKDNRMNLTDAKEYIFEAYGSSSNLYSMNLPCKLGLNGTDFDHSTWRSMTYAWGSLAKNKGFDYLAMWSCNYTWVEVDTKVNLIASEGNLVLNPEKPPVPDLATARPWSRPFDVPPISNAFSGQPFGSPYPLTPGADGVGTDYLSRELTTLLKPYGQFDLKAFGDPEQEDDVLAALTYNFAFIGSQLANIENRLGKDKDDMYHFSPQNSLSNLNAIAANNDRYRLVQTSTVTYIIVGILVAVAIVNILVLLSVALRRFVGRPILFDMDIKGLAPDGFQSIAAMNDLLKDSNIFKYLPDGVLLLSSKELYGRLSDLNFRMGWFSRTSDMDKVFTVGVEGDDDFVYMGSKANSKKNTDVEMITSEDNSKAGVQTRIYAGNNDRVDGDTDMSR